MTNNLASAISRRRFLEHTSVAGSIAFVAPGCIFAETNKVAAPGLVEQARKGAAAATINIHVSVLMGAGGNIAVLPGRGGKLLIHAGFAGARPKIAEALASLSSDPIAHLINTHWHFDHTDGNEWLHSAGRLSLPMRTPASIFPARRESRGGTLPFRLRPRRNSYSGL
jgi:glyoxylase-like metal-dependent hydrolase (beta-lactamase superfamily II)